MPVEMYLRPDVQLPSADEGLEEVEARQELLSQLGLTRLGNYERHTLGRLEKAGLLYPELTGKALRTWRKFLPTQRRLDNFDFDLPPTEALQAIKTAKEQGCFDHIEIWTPDGNRARDFIAQFIQTLADTTSSKLQAFRARLDPMAVGVIEDADGSKRCYQIVRWGESLVPFKKVQGKVRRTNIVLAAVCAVLLTAAAYGAASYYNGIVQHGFVAMIVISLITIVCLAFITMLLVDVLDL